MNRISCGKPTREPPTQARLIKNELYLSLPRHQAMSSPSWWNVLVEYQPFKRLQKVATRGNNQIIFKIVLFAVQKISQSPFQSIPVPMDCRTIQYFWIIDQVPTFNSCCGWALCTAQCSSNEELGSASGIGGRIVLIMVMSKLCIWGIAWFVRRAFSGWITCYYLFYLFTFQRFW